MQKTGIDKMKTWLAGDVYRECASVVVAETRGKAVVAHMRVVGAGDGEFTDHYASRFPALDYLAEGVNETTAFDCSDNVADFIKAERCSNCVLVDECAYYARELAAIKARDGGV